MIYSIRHVTTYRYGSEVAYARCILRLIPCTCASQTLLQSSITVEPRPAAKVLKADTFGESTVTTVIATPHRKLVIDSRSLVDVHAPAIGDPIGATPNSLVNGALTAARTVVSVGP